SRKRAQSVKQYFIDKGIDPKMIRSAGYGETKPKVPNTSKENKAKNRRVEFELTGAMLNVQIINR
ncbi:MAG: OmpA family protein, partial [Deltaproteobacteria bacterium]|nr:OmpA family protein [Deltaproteobacteria bacterium]